MFENQKRPRFVLHETLTYIRRDLYLDQNQIQHRNMQKENTKRDLHTYEKRCSYIKRDLDSYYMRL